MASLLSLSSFLPRGRSLKWPGGGHRAPQLVLCNVEAADAAVRAEDVQKFATICIPSGGIVHEGILAFMSPAHRV